MTYKNTVISRIALKIMKLKDATYLDKDNISWKYVDNILIGKRSVWTFDFRSCWLEETTIDNVKSWWCGEDSDYEEVFTNTK